MALGQLFPSAVYVRGQKKHSYMFQHDSSPLAPVVLREDRDHPLQGPQHGSVDQHRPLHLPRFAGLADLHVKRKIGRGRREKGMQRCNRKGEGVCISDFDTRRDSGVQRIASAKIGKGRLFLELIRVG